MEADVGKAIEFAKKYINEFPRSITDANFVKYLRSGVPLCNLLNYIHAGFVPVPKITPMAHKANILAFFDGCRRLGVPEKYFFAPEDLMNETNPNAVIVCICALADTVEQQPQPQSQPPTQEIQQSSTPLAPEMIHMSMEEVPILNTSSTMESTHANSSPNTATFQSPSQWTSRPQNGTLRGMKPVLSIGSRHGSGKSSSPSPPQSQQQVIIEQDADTSAIMIPHHESVINMTYSPDGKQQEIQHQQIPPQQQMNSQQQINTQQMNSQQQEQNEVFTPRQTAHQTTPGMIQISQAGDDTLEKRKKFELILQAFLPKKPSSEELAGRGYALSTSDSGEQTSQPAQASQASLSASTLSASSSAAAAQQKGGGKKFKLKNFFHKGDTLRGGKQPDDDGNVGDGALPLDVSLEMLTNTMMNAEDVANFAAIYGEGHRIQNEDEQSVSSASAENLRALMRVIRDKITFERQNAKLSRQGRQIDIVEMCARALDLDRDVPRECYAAPDGHVDQRIEHLVVKLELRALIFELAAMRVALEIADTCTKLQTKNDMLNSMLTQANTERLNTKNKLNQALGVDQREEGLAFEQKKDPKTGAVVKDAFVLVGGTAEKLTDRLFNARVANIPEYVNNFLIVYRSFTDPMTVLHAAIAKYDATEPQPGDDKLPMDNPLNLQNKNRTRVRVLNFFKQWLEKAYSDFENDYALKCELVKFQNLHQGTPIFNIINKRVAEDSAGGSSAGSMYSEPAPEPLIPTAPNYTLETVDPLEVMRQLTIVQFDLYKAIQPHEFLGQGWAKKNKEERSPNLLRMIQHFNDIGSHVALSIVSELDVRRRAALVVRCIHIIEEAQKIQNYFCVFAISAALNSSSISRLKKTWEEVNRTYKNADKAMAITVPTANYQEYRNIIRTITPPALPYIGLFLSDLTFIEDGNPDTLEVEGAGEKKYVNFAKQEMVAKVIQEFQKFLVKPYNFKMVPEMNAWLSCPQTASEKECFDKSLIAEPREHRQTN